MKKYLVLPLIVLFTLVSCEKQDDAHQDLKLSDLSSLDYINLSLDNNTLVFKTLGDFEEMFNYMNNLDPSLYPEFEKFINIYSLGKSCQVSGQVLPTDDEVALSLLNSDGSLIIQNFKFTYDFENEILEVEDISSPTQLSKAVQYSFDEEVFDIVFNSAPRSATKSVLITFCSTKSTQNTWHLTNCDVEIKLKYNNVPGFYKLKASIDESPSRSGVYIYLWIGNYLPPGYDTYWQSRKLCSSGPNGATGGYGGSYSLNIYSSVVNRLDAYDAYADFLASDEYVAPPQTYKGILHLTCDVGSITCD